MPPTPPTHQSCLDRLIGILLGGTPGDLDQEGLEGADAGLELGGDHPGDSAGTGELDPHDPKGRLEQERLFRVHAVKEDLHRRLVRTVVRILQRIPVRERPPHRIPHKPTHQRMLQGFSCLDPVGHGGCCGVWETGTDLGVGCVKLAHDPRWVKGVPG